MKIRAGWEDLGSNNRFITIYITTKHIEKDRIPQLQCQENTAFLSRVTGHPQVCGGFRVSTDSGRHEMSRRNSILHAEVTEECQSSVPGLSLPPCFTRHGKGVRE